MGFFGKVKQAFGFGSNGEYEDFEDTYGVDATVKPLSTRHRDDESGDDVAGADTLTGGRADDTPDEPVADTRVPIESIFNTVVDEFNRAMPSFLSSGVNAEAQRHHLYEMLETDVKAYMERVQTVATEQCNKRWERERRSLNGEIDTLKERVKGVTDTEADKSRQLLSAERQKRAMTERIHDLEGKIANLEAEKDQYELETRSLVNKLRVSNMLNEGVEVPDVAKYEHDIEALQSTNRSLEEQVESLRVKTEMTDVMLNDLNARAAAAGKEAAAKDAEIQELKEKLDEATRHADDIRSQLEQAHANLEIAASIQTEVERIQQAVETKDNTIAELQNQLRHREERINALEAEETSLRRTIETNLMAQVESEKSLRDEIARLEQSTAAAVQNGQGAKGRGKRKSGLRISAIDEDLDNTDWLVATPPEGVSAKTSGVPDSEFGYQEPQRKTPPENSAQMSLW